MRSAGAKKAQAHKEKKTGGSAALTAVTGARP